MGSNLISAMCTSHQGVNHGSTELLDLSSGCPRLAGDTQCQDQFGHTDYAQDWDLQQHSINISTSPTLAGEPDCSWGLTSCSLKGLLHESECLKEVSMQAEMQTGISIQQGPGLDGIWTFPVGYSQFFSKDATCKPAFCFTPQQKTWRFLLRALQLFMGTFCIAVIPPHTAWSYWAVSWRPSTVCIITGGLAALSLQQDFGHCVLLKDSGHDLHLLPLRQTFCMASALYSTVHLFVTVF